MLHLQTKKTWKKNIIVLGTVEVCSRDINLPSQTDPKGIKTVRTKEKSRGWLHTSLQDSLQRLPGQWMPSRHIAESNLSPLASTHRWENNKKHTIFELIEIKSKSGGSMWLILCLCPKFISTGRVPRTLHTLVNMSYCNNSPGGAKGEPKRPSDQPHCPMSKDVQRIKN